MAQKAKSSPIADRQSGGSTSAQSDRADSETADLQSIEQLRDRYQKLHTRKIQAETSLDHAKQELERLKQEAREKYQTDDLAELRRQLAKMTEENEEKRRTYQAGLDQIESDLAAVEEKFSTAADSTEDEEVES